MIKLEIGEKVPPKYTNVVVLSAKFMHGDADSQSQASLIASADNQKQLEIVKAVWDAYISFPHWSGPWKSIPEQILIRTSTGFYAEPPLGEEDATEYYAYEGSPDMELEDDMGVGGELGSMFPWDQEQAQIGMYENRAKLEKFSLTYYDADGQPFEVTLTNLIPDSL